MARRPEYVVPGFLAREQAAHEAKERERARSVERRVLKRAFAGFAAAGKAALKAGEPERDPDPVVRAAFDTLYAFLDGPKGRRS